ncbi:hypothetical protein L596_030047 [Steinernema carpocapsae]|uniref:Uncharacterized protein n=1 Tax=Steinernema carpocapsae TaxID=34508 RepID=A0A4V5ZX69_STECR|nr:hypothetical protein L596_030047 [Steinernema carpocapsae]
MSVSVGLAPRVGTRPWLKVTSSSSSTSRGSARIGAKRRGDAKNGGSTHKVNILGLFFFFSHLRFLSSVLLNARPKRLIPQTEPINPKCNVIPAREWTTVPLVTSGRLKGSGYRTLKERTS